MRHRNRSLNICHQRFRRVWTVQLVSFQASDQAPERMSNPMHSLRITQSKMLYIHPTFFCNARSLETGMRINENGLLLTYFHPFATQHFDEYLPRMNCQQVKMRPHAGADPVRCIKLAAAVDMKSNRHLATPS